MRQADDIHVDVVVLTALDLEYEAVRSHLLEVHTHVDANGTRYQIGTTPSGRCSIALGITGPGNVAAASLTGRVVAGFRPKVVAVVGVAGGLGTDIDLGDVVVATRVHAYHSGRAENGTFRPRPKSWPLAHGLEQDARDLARDGTWTQLLPEDTTKMPRVHFKPIVSGEVVLDGSWGEIPELIAAHYNDAVAIDMESAGVAEAAHHNDFPRTISVRAVSDRADGHKRKADASGWQKRAASNAATFAIALAERIVGKPESSLPADASPYRGLGAFGEEDSDLFFGRAETTEELASMVYDRRFLAVAGRSGSGKSSLVHAGLIPAARRRGWAVAAFRAVPGVPATVALAGGLLPLLRPELDRGEAFPHRAALADVLATDRVAEVVSEILQVTGASRLLVCVDQFEELVAWREDAAADLASLLMQLATCPVPVHIVLTVRTETLDVVVHRLGLGGLIRNSVFLLTPMNAEQLRAAIEEPIRSSGVRFEPGLVVRILDDARDAPAALTLMQFALTRLWDEQDRGRMAHHVYDAFHGIGGAIASYAEQVWETQLDETQRGATRRLLVQLARPEADGFVRRTARGRDLAPELVPLARHLASTRLLVTGTDATGELTVDLAHAALATHWQRLNDWLTEERDFRVWQEDLRESIRRTEPLRGTRLVDALRWSSTHRHGISGSEHDFIQFSRRRRRQARVLWRGLLAVVLTLLVVTSTFMIGLGKRTRELQDQLHRNAAQALVTQARDRIGNHPDIAMLLSVAAYRASDEPAALINLAGEYQRYRTTDQVLNPRVGQVIDMAMSADGRTVAVAGLDGAAVLHLDRRPAVVERYGRDVRRVALTQDGRLLATANDLGRIELRGQDGTHAVLRAGGPQADLPTVLRFDDRGHRLLATPVTSGLAVWDVAGHSEIPVPVAVKRAGQAPNSVWFGPNGQSVVVLSAQQLSIWSLDGSTSAQRVALDGRSHTVTAGDGRTAITCTEGTLVYWDLVTATERKRVHAPGTSCPAPNQATTDHRGRVVTAYAPPESGSHPRTALWLVTQGADGPARVAVPAAAEPGSTVAPQLSSNENGSRMAIVIGTGIAVVNVPATAFTPVNAAGASSPLFSPDLRYGITSSPAPMPSIHLWDTRTGKVVKSVPNPSGLRPRWFSSDGRRLLALDQATQRVVVFETPSFRVVGQVELTEEMRQNREQFPGRFNIMCFADLPSPEEVAIVYAGLVMRVDVRSGIVVDTPLRLWRTHEDLARLADTVSCHGRPRSTQIAFDVGRGVEMWDLDSRKRVHLPVDDIGTISSVRFSADGQLLAVSGFAGVVSIWDVEHREQNGRPRQVVEASLGVEVKGFPSADRIVVRGGVALRVWDLNREAAIADVETAAPDSGAVTPDGGALLYWGLAGFTRMPLDPEQWAEHLCRVVGRDLGEEERQSLPHGSPAEPVC